MVIRTLLAFLIFTPFLPVSDLHATDTISIGCILPLSGKFAAFGNKTLQGVELAIERYNSTDAGKKRPVRLLIKDSKGIPEAAEKAVEELEREGVSLIIGPILGSTAESAARKAQGLKIPIITMTQKGGITDIGDWVFRNCITNEAQIQGLVGYAVSTGIKRVAVLYPDNQYGRELNSIFSREVTGRGGIVVASYSYNEGQTDFGKEIKSLLEKSKRQKFDAIFIPDYAERVGLIVPQLAFYDITDVWLLGTSGWNSPRLIKLAGSYLSRAVFTDGFFGGSKNPNVRDFVEQYRRTFGEEPGILEAQAFDTAGIAISMAGINSRDGVREALLKVRGYHGVSGEITFRGRDAERTVYLLTVREGRIEEIEPRSR